MPNPPFLLGEAWTPTRGRRASCHGLDDSGCGCSDANGDRTHCIVHSPDCLVKARVCRGLHIH